MRHFTGFVNATTPSSVSRPIGSFCRAWRKDLFQNFLPEPLRAWCNKVLGWLRWPDPASGLERVLRRFRSAPPCRSCDRDRNQSGHASCRSAARRYGGRTNALERPAKFLRFPAALCVVENGKGKAAQARNGGSGHSPPRRNLLLRQNKGRSTSGAGLRRAPAGVHVLALRPSRICRLARSMGRSAPKRLRRPSSWSPVCDWSWSRPNR